MSLRIKMKSYLEEEYFLFNDKNVNKLGAGCSITQTLWKMRLAHIRRCLFNNSHAYPDVKLCPNNVVWSFLDTKKRPFCPPLKACTIRPFDFDAMRVYTFLNYL